MHVKTSAVLPFILLATSGLGRHLTRRDAPFDWSALNSSTHISWTPCYDSFECARLTVPLQYSNATAGEAQIALIMSPSNFSSGNPDYLGSILFNPGGPGGSGVDYIRENGDYFRTIIGPQYDLVGFDPRAVGETTPVLSVFKDPQEALELYATFPLNAEDSVSSLGRAYAISQIVANLVDDRAKLVAESVSTPAVAMDMLQIARALGQDKVNYWGISYGSILGATFAAMFPDNVGRFIIDGVSDAYEWYYGPGVRDNSSLLDADAALTSIYDACVAAGPSLCALWENSTELVRTRVQRDLDALRTAPLPLYNDTAPTGVTFGVLDYATVFEALFQTVYFPYNQGTTAAALLVALEQGDGSGIYQGSTESALNDIGSTCVAGDEPFVLGYIEATAPIICGDSLAGRKSSFAQYQEDYQATRELSPFAAAWFPDFFGPCAVWSMQGKDRFNGSFETNTSTPILFISNSLDPVTPIQSGRKMSAGFKDSVLLQQNSTGHTSLSGFSTCTALAIRAYFQNGTLPAPDTICQPDTQIFVAPTNSSGFGGVTISTRGTYGFDPREAARLAQEGISFLKKMWFRRGVL